MRIIKSAIAMAICYLINMLRGDAGIVFYSQLAALWCIQMYRSNSIKNAIQRTIGTAVGAIYGLIYLLIYPELAMKVDKPIVVEITLVTILLLLVLYTTVVVNKKQASYFSCVVFLSIAVNHVGDVVPYLFVWNRFLDTMIGIAIGIAINNVRICFNPDRETLFVSGLDDTLLGSDELLSPFSKVELNRMIDSGLKFTISTTRTPASLIEPMRDVRLNLPLIVMDGAALFDLKKNRYLHTVSIPSDLVESLYETICESGICWYANVIIDDVLIIYYGDTDDEINNSLVKTLKVSPYRNYLKRALPLDEPVIYFMLLDKSEKINEFSDKLNHMSYAERLRINTYKSDDYEGYSYIKIYSRNANKSYMLDYLKQTTGLSKTVTFGTIEGQYDVLVQEDNANEVVRRVRKMYEPFIMRKK
ncbi:MAG: HAD hydrolase family protein [Clostridia bacterium]|nr:HAD hydrolase family protein [Clostridia bacterium]